VRRGGALHLHLHPIPAKLALGNAALVVQSPYWTRNYAGTDFTGCQCHSIMSTQYNDIGQRYGSLSKLASDHLEPLSMAKVLGRVGGLNCLDMACGLGRGCRLLVAQGAAHVVGIDISEAMVKSAREAFANQDDHSTAKIDFDVGDCSKPFSAPGGPFDVIIGMWFLNYASCHVELVSMFQNIHRNLKPGGRFVGLTINAFVDMETPFDDRYGIEMCSTGKTAEAAYKCIFRANTGEEPFQADYFHLPHTTYEQAAADARMENITWRSHVLPENDDQPEGYWDVFNLRPHFSILTATKPL
jgi:toxoflavin synthase